MDRTEQDSFDHPPGIPSVMYFVNTTTYIITTKMCMIQYKKKNLMHNHERTVKGLT